MGLDAHRFKYVIAREGLVVVALLAGAALSFYADSWQKDQINTYTKTAKSAVLLRAADEFERYHVTYQDKGRAFERYLADAWKRTHAVPGIKVQFPRETSLGVMNQVMNGYHKAQSVREWYDWEPAVDPFAQDVADSSLRYTAPLAPGASSPSDNNQINARYDDKGNRLFKGFPWSIDFQKAVVFFLFVAYPANLLVRFIAWAIATVRKPSCARS
jgi:hypothetical protein